MLKRGRALGVLECTIPRLPGFGALAAAMATRRIDAHIHIWSASLDAWLGHSPVVGPSKVAAIAPVTC